MVPLPTHLCTEQTPLETASCCKRRSPGYSSCDRNNAVVLAAPEIPTDSVQANRCYMTPLRLLQVEDTEDDAALVIAALTRAGYHVFARRVDTASDLRRELGEAEWDLVIADYTMAGFSGTKALAIVREQHPDLPFIFVSGTIGEDTAVAAMKTGAHDYIMKGNLARLAPAVDRELREATVRRERNLANQRVAYLAYHDSLTDLPNRALVPGSTAAGDPAIASRRARPHGAADRSRRLQGSERRARPSRRRSGAAGSGDAVARRLARVRYGGAVGWRRIRGVAAGHRCQSRASWRREKSSTISNIRLLPTAGR